jgi:diketogulonate reductase-like aldo/keto reductase
VYRNETPSAAGIKGSGVPRDQLFFTSKVSPRDMTYSDATKSVNASLKRTGLEYIDLYLLHAPFGGKAGRLGAWKALAEAVEVGKVRSIGVSNYGVHHLEELEAHIDAEEAVKGKGKAGVLSVNQVELHPWLARPDIVKWCKDRGVLLEVSKSIATRMRVKLTEKAYSPLVRGDRMKDPILQKLAKKHGKTEAQILLRWSLQMVYFSPNSYWIL